MALPLGELSAKLTERALPLLRVLFFAALRSYTKERNIGRSLQPNQKCFVGNGLRAVPLFLEQSRVLTVSKA